MKAVMQDGMALQYASETLRDHKDIVLAAIMNTDAPLAYASERLKKDKEILNAVFILSENKDANDSDKNEELDDLMF
jgi:hypothetical protein